MLGLEKSEDEELEKLGAEFFSYEIPSIVFQQAVKAVPNSVQFLVSFIDIYRLFDGTEQRQEEVYSWYGVIFSVSYPLTQQLNL